MPRDDLSIDFVKHPNRPTYVDQFHRAMPEPLDPSAVLDEWINRVQNLPEEIMFLLKELADKDNELHVCMECIEDYDGQIQKWIRLHGSHEPNPKEPQLRSEIEKQYRKAGEITDKKQELSRRMHLLTDKHTRSLDVHLKHLYDRDEPGFRDPSEIPSLLTGSGSTVTTPASALASSLSTTFPLSASVHGARTPSSARPFLSLDGTSAGRQASAPLLSTPKAASRAALNRLQKTSVSASSSFTQNAADATADSLSGPGRKYAASAMSTPSTPYYPVSSGATSQSQTPTAASAASAVTNAGSAAGRAATPTHTGTSTPIQTPQQGRKRRSMSTKGGRGRGRANKLALAGGAESELSEAESAVYDDDLIVEDVKRARRGGSRTPSLAHHLDGDSTVPSAAAAAASLSTAATTTSTTTATGRAGSSRAGTPLAGQIKRESSFSAAGGSGGRGRKSSPMVAVSDGTGDKAGADSFSSVDSAKGTKGTKTTKRKQPLGGHGRTKKRMSMATRILEDDHDVREDATLAGYGGDDQGGGERDGKRGGKKGRVKRGDAAHARVDGEGEGDGDDDDGDDDEEEEEEEEEGEGEDREAKDGNENEDEDEDDDDDAADDKRYCLCRNVSFGDMVACDNEACPFEWFHWSCVGLKSEPNGAWFCPVCSSKRRQA